MGWLRRLLGLEGPREPVKEVPTGDVLLTYGGDPTPPGSGHCVSEWPQAHPRTFSANYRATLRTGYLPIAGEREFQGTLRPLYARAGEGYARPAVFVLRRDGGGDRIRVMTKQLEPVGYLSKKDERAYHAAFELLEQQYDTIWCEGLIEPSSSGTGTLNVELDLATASECIQRANDGRTESGTYRRSRSERNR